MYVSGGKVHQALHFHSNFGNFKPFSRSPMKGGAYCILPPILNAERLLLFYFYFFALFLFLFCDRLRFKREDLSIDRCSQYLRAADNNRKRNRTPLLGGWGGGGGGEKPHCKLHNNSQPASAPALSMYLWCVTVKYSSDEAVDSVPLLFCGRRFPLAHLWPWGLSVFLWRSSLAVDMYRCQCEEKSECSVCRRSKLGSQL